MIISFKNYDAVGPETIHWVQGAVLAVPRVDDGVCIGKTLMRVKNVIFSYDLEKQDPCLVYVYVEVISDLQALQRQSP